MAQSMARSRAARFTVRELSPSTWRDFAAFFAKYHGVQDSCWCMHYHRTRPNYGLPAAERAAQNREDHRRLVGQGNAHGVLVYSQGRAVGWCQFGRTAELPRIDAGQKYRALGERRDPPPDWRITCFFVDRGHRRAGVAEEALVGALDAIQRRGGGLVEAYPATDPRAVANWFGSASMFRRHGFAMVAPFGRSNVLMRRDLPASEVLGRPRSRVP
jgi:GNAT superfamily N-acetyltransferase